MIGATIPGSGLSRVVVDQGLFSRIPERKTRHSPDNAALRDAGFMETPLNRFFNERSDPRTLDALTSGPLAAPLNTYAQQLHDQGYTVSSSRSQLRVLGHFSRWLKSNGLAAEQIDSSMLERYVRCLRKSGKLRRGDTTALGRLWRMLRPGEVETPLLASECLPHSSASISALFVPGARIGRGNHCLLHAGCACVSGRVFSD